MGESDVDIGDQGQLRMRCRARGGCDQRSVSDPVDGQHQRQTEQNTH